MSGRGGCIRRSALRGFGLAAGDGGAAKSFDGVVERIARLFAVIVVTLLALPFVFGPLRTTGAGTRTVVGVLLGVVFFLITRTIENGGQLFNANPAVVGWLPTAAIGVITLIAISRTR